MYLFIYCAKQCSLISKKSEILPTSFKSLSNFTFTEHDIEKIQLNLNPNKA